MKLKRKSRRIRTFEELCAIEDEFPAVCGPNPVLYAARHGLKLSKSYMEFLKQQAKEKNGNAAPRAKSRGK